MMHIATRRFDHVAQERFARLWGDRNPMHLDTLSARRTQAGAPVVHGINAVLWALDELYASGSLDRPIGTLDVRFQKFIYLDMDVTLRFTRRTLETARAEIMADDLVCTTIALGFEPSGAHVETPFVSDETAVATAPAVLRAGDIMSCAGWIAPRQNGNFEFPGLANATSAGSVETIALLSTLVGMICPGRDSIFSSFRIDRVSHAPAGEGLYYRTARFDERFRLAEIAVGGSGWQGSVSAFLRHPPIAQPDIGTVGTLVRDDEFAGITALVIGGSRGMGALTTRLLIAGGANVIATYAVGEADAAEIAGELGERCRTMRYDARSDPAAQVAGIGPVHQLYYFATPQIFRQRSVSFVPATFAEFAEFYVTGFWKACNAVRAVSGLPLTAFYPSSVALNEHARDMIEYRMAKLAGETLCAEMNRFDKGTRVLVRRLPRLLTDQTATVMPVESADPLSILPPILREMHSLLSTSS